MKIFTIGFTKTTAENFFGRLKNSGAREIVDVRLHNKSQLAGFAKRTDLPYFAKTILDQGYRHLLQLAPSQEAMDAFKTKSGSWSAFERTFLELMAKRRIEELDRSSLEDSCLLCSEDKPHHCHRRLVAEYLQDRWDDVEIVHL